MLPLRSGTLTDWSSRCAVSASDLLQFLETGKWPNQAKSRMSHNICFATFPSINARSRNLLQCNQTMRSSVPRLVLLAD